MRIIAIALFLCSGVAAQKPAFDVVSVKPAGDFVPGAFGRMNGGPGTDDPGRITWTGVSLQNLLRAAYVVGADQISGPSWLDGEVFKYSYTITATMPRDTTMDNFRLMLQALLAERFRVMLHHETRDFPGYELVIAPGGTKFHEAPPEPNPRRGSQFLMAGPNATVLATIPDLPAGLTGVTRTPPMGRWGMFRSSYHISMADFIRGLGAMVNESSGFEMIRNIPRITDKTGLMGEYEFTLEFAGISITPTTMGGSDLSHDPDPGSAGPTIFNALEQQLGLRLTKVKSVPVDTLVIDHAEKVPTPD